MSPAEWDHHFTGLAVHVGHKPTGCLKGATTGISDRPAADSDTLTFSHGPGAHPRQIAGFHSGRNAQAKEGIFTGRTWAFKVVKMSYASRPIQLPSGSQQNKTLPVFQERSKWAIQGSNL